jgi:hypothetical protein
MLRIAHALPDVSTNMVAHTFDLLLGNNVAEVTEIHHENSKEFYIQLYDSRDLRQSRFLNEIDNNGHAKVYYTPDNFWVVTSR